MLDDRGRPVDLGRPKQRAVLAVLLTEAGRVVSVERLLELLWGEAAPARSMGSLRSYVSNLRRVLEPDRAARDPARVLVTQAPGYLLRVSPEEVDASRFETLATEGRRHLDEGRPRAAARVLDEALALWRGPALAEFAYDDFAVRQAARLEELRALAIEDRWAAAMALGAHAQAVAGFEATVAERPLRERSWELLMLALYRSGRQGEALAAYGRIRRHLAEELGLDPGPALRRLEADILAQSPDLDWSPPAEAVAATPTRSVAEPVGGPGPDTLIGREVELGAMVTALEHASAGRGSVAVIGGEPGVGKTRLVREMAEQSAARGFLVAWGQAEEGDGAPPFWPWIGVIRSLVDNGEPGAVGAALAPGASEIAQVVPEIKELTGDVTPPSSVDAVSARFRLYHAVSRFLTALSQTVPIVVILDDLQWADRPSLELAVHLAKQLDASPTMVMATYRDVDPPPGPDLVDALGALARVPSCSHLALRGLEAAEVGQVLARATGTDVSPDQAADAWRRTEGNPFFVTELARLPAADRALGGPGEAAGAVPAGVRQVIRRRLGRLPGTTTALLRVAAVAGREFDLRVVAAAQGIDEDEAMELLDLAVATGLVTEDPATAVGRYRFSHGLVQETVYGEVGAARRARLHAVVAQALEDVAGERVHPAELAHHLYEAAPLSGPDAGISAAVRAAEAAEKSLAFEQAEAQLGRALDLVARMPPGKERNRRELDVQDHLGTLMTMVKGLTAPETARAWERARELCEEEDDRKRLLRTLWGLMVPALARVDLAAAARLGEYLLGFAGDWEATMAGEFGLGAVDLLKGDAVEGRRRIDLAIALYKANSVPGSGETPLVDPTVGGLTWLALATWLCGDEDGARHVASTARANADALGIPFAVALGQVFEGLVLVLARDVEAARRRAQELLTLAEDQHLPDFAVQAEVMLGWATSLTDGPEAGADAAAEAYALMRAGGFRIFGTMFLGMIAEARWQEGRPDDALLSIEEGLAEMEATGERFYGPELHRLRAAFLAAGPTADLAAAASSLRQAVEVATAQVSPHFLRRAEADLATLGGPTTLV